MLVFQVELFKYNCDIKKTKIYPYEILHLCKAILIQPSSAAAERDFLFFGP